MRKPFVLLVLLESFFFGSAIAVATTVAPIETTSHATSCICTTVVCVNGDTYSEEVKGMCEWNDATVYTMVLEPTEGLTVGGYCGEQGGVRSVSHCYQDFGVNIIEAEWQFIVPKK